MVTRALHRLTLVTALCTAAFAANAHAKIPGGALDAFTPEGETLGACPLKHTEVTADISGFVTRVTVTQQFHNPYDTFIEAVYTFPLSDRAAVDAMTMAIGDRVIEGDIKKREEARQIYEHARAAGQTASLLDQERPNIFTQSVANIPPGQNIDITLSYVEYLKYDDGEYEFSFPMTIGPRYMPGGLTPGGTTEVPDANRVWADVPPEGQRAGHDIALTVNLDAGIPVQNLASELHEVDIARTGAAMARVSLKTRKEIPNRDFVLRYAVAGKKIEDAVLVHTDDRGGFFTLILQPPARVEPNEVAPKEIIFVIDSSGSMSGFPIEKAKESMRLCIQNLNPNDTFNLVSFAGGLGYAFKESVPNTKANRDHALQYLSNLQGGGGTEMMAAINAALTGQTDERLRVVCFMTDGFIGNDMAILDAIQQHRQTARVFAFGIGNSVNRFLIEGMAREGRGAMEIVTLESEGEEAAQRFYERVNNPLLTNIQLDFGGLKVSDLHPAPEFMPDLFSAQPLIVTGRYDKPGAGNVTIRGNTAAGAYERQIDVKLPKKARDHDVLAPLWARKEIDMLMARDWQGIQMGNPKPEIKTAVTDLGLEYNLVTQFTSFVAVEKKVVNEGGRQRTIEVPVEMPDGVSYEGIFGADGRRDLARVRSAGAAGGLAGGGNLQAQTLAVAPPPAMAPPPPPSPVAELPARRIPLGDVANKPVVTNEVSESEAMPEIATDEDRLSTSALAKIDPALRNLAEKLVNGAYRSGNVEVVNNEVRVYLILTDDTDANLDNLRALGVDILAHARSGKRLDVRVPVTLLEDLARLPFVARIMPRQ